MSLLGFQYLKRHRILTLTLILTLSSTLFSVTAFSFQGFYQSFNAYMGEGEDIVAIYDRGSQTPFTGLIPQYLADLIGAMDGVLASSPEVIFPCIIMDASVFLRGIIPEEFSKINPLTIIEGEMPKLSDLNAMVVGKRLAERLGLRLGDRVLVLGVLKSQYFELQVKGIFESNGPLDDEALAPLYVGQWLRGSSYGHVTLIRVKIDPKVVSAAEIFKELAEEAKEPTPGSGGSGSSGGILPWVIRRFSIEKVWVEDAQKIMKTYLDRYGVTREALLLLSIMVFLFSSASVTSASNILLRQHRSEIRILKSIGASNRTIKVDLIVKVLVWSLAASTVGIILAMGILTFIQGNNYLQVLSHRAYIQFDPLIITLNLTLVSILITLSIVRSDLR